MYIYIYIYIYIHTQFVYCMYIINIITYYSFYIHPSDYLSIIIHTLLSYIDYLLFKFLQICRYRMNYFQWVCCNEFWDHFFCYGHKICFKARWCFGVAFVCPNDVLKYSRSRQLATFGAAVSLAEANSVPVCLQEFEDDALSPETHPANEWTYGPDWQDALKRETHQFRLVRQLWLVMPQAVWEIGVCVCVCLCTFHLTTFTISCYCVSSRVMLSILHRPGSPESADLSVHHQGHENWRSSSPLHLWSQASFPSVWVCKTCIKLYRNGRTLSSWCAFWKVPWCNMPSEIPLMDLHFITSLTKIHF